MNDDRWNRLEEGKPVTVDGISMEHPACWARTEDGAFVVVDEGAVQDVECTAYLFDDQSTLVKERTFPGAAAACAVHPEGRFTVIATLKPDERLYALDMDSGTEKWCMKNYEGFAHRSKRPQVTDLSIDSGCISVYTTGIEAYHLSEAGAVLDEDREKQETYRGLDDNDPSVISLVESDLDDPDLENNVYALLELEIRADDPFVRKHLPDFAPRIMECIERHEVHTLNLTDPSVPEAHRKLMSAGKRLVFEACRERPAVLESILATLKTHLQNQPEQAIYSDLQQLKQLAPESMDVSELVNSTSSSSCSELDSPSGARSVDQEPTDQRGTDRGGCCVFAFAVAGAGFAIVLTVLVFYSPLLWQ